MPPLDAYFFSKYENLEIELKNVIIWLQTSLKSIQAVRRHDDDELYITADLMGICYQIHMMSFQVTDINKCNPRDVWFDTNNGQNIIITVRFQRINVGICKEGSQIYEII